MLLTMNLQYLPSYKYEQVGEPEILDWNAIDDAEYL